MLSRRPAVRAPDAASRVGERSANRSIPLVGHTLGTESQIVSRFNGVLNSSLASLGAPDSFTDAD